MNSGIKGSMAGTSLAQGITRLLAPTDKGKAIMEQFGMEVKRNADGGMDLDATIRSLQGGFSKMSKENQVANAKLIFGQTALKGWLPIVTASKEEFDELTEAIKNSAGASEEMMDEISKSGAYQFKIMVSAIQDFLIVVGDALAPAMADVANWLTEMATKLSNWVSKMKETNPEMLAFIGKLGMMAVIVPPLIMLFGNFTSGIGMLFKGISGGIDAFVKLRKGAEEVAQGLSLAEGKTGFLTRKLGTLVSGIGGTTLALGAAGVALVGVATAIGTNESALTWLQEKWGKFGEFIGGTCEFIAGIVQITFGNIGHLIAGIGKSIGALLTGNWRDIDDIWRETWAKMENTTAKAVSNIAAESTRGISTIRKASAEELAGLEENFDTVFEKIKGLTRDNYKEVGVELSEFVKGLNSDMLLMMRGTSDSMAVLLDGINDSMTLESVTKRLQENLKGMATSGKYTTDQLSADFAKAKELIVRNMKDASTRVAQEVSNVTKHIGRLAQDGVDNVARNIQGTVKSMDEETFNTLKSMGDTWGALFKDVEFGNANMSTIIVENLRAMGTDTNAIIDSLNKEMSGSFDETGKKIKETADSTTQETTEAFSTMVETIKNTSGKGVNELATIFVEGLKTMDAETILSLQGTSDQWYSILHGAVDSSGKLSDNMAQTVLGNLNWISNNTPGGLEGFKTGLLDALVKANLITEDEMTAIVNTVSQKSGEAAQTTEGTGEEIAENVAPKGAKEKTEEALNEVNQTINEKTEGIKEATGKAGEEAQKNFDEKVSQLGKDVTVDSNIINVEALSLQFQNAGTLAVQNFVQGWSANVGLITEAIGISLQTLSLDLAAPMQIIQANMDGVIAKTSILTDSMNGLKVAMTSIQAINLQAIVTSLDNIIAKTVGASTNVTILKAELDKVGAFSTAAVTQGFTDLSLRAQDVKRSINECINEMRLFSVMNLTTLIADLDKFKVSSDNDKKAVIELKKELDKLLATSFYNFLFYLGEISTKVQTATDKTGTLKSKIQDLNNITFGTLTSRLQGVVDSLQSVVNKADAARGAVSSVKRPSILGSILGGGGSEQSIALASLNASLRSVANVEKYRDTVNMARYQTSGSYYSPNSLAGSGSQARAMNNQSKQLEVLKEQNELLKQVIFAMNNNTNNINLTVDLDGRQVAKSTAKYMQREIETINKRKGRLGGNF